jgi:predicted NBD/HSP70 family sugar kinase
MRDLAQIQVNDKLANSIIKKVATRIGADLIDVIHIIGPKAVFIGGKMAVLGDALI